MTENYQIFVCVRRVQVPMPLMSVREVITAVTSASCSNATTPNQQPAEDATVHFIGFVSSISTPTQTLHTCKVECHSCKCAVDMAAGSIRLPCCDRPAYSDAFSEDISGRVYIPTQSIWVSPKLEATGFLQRFGVSQPVVEVQLTDDLVDTVTLGDFVKVFGTAQLISEPQGPASERCHASVQVLANNVSPAAPHEAWLQPICATHNSIMQSGVPLQSMCDCLEAVTGCCALDTSTNLALLLSAALISQAAHTKPQINVILMQQDENDPLTLRALRQRAQLLVPQSASLHTAHVDNPLAPKVSRSKKIDNEALANHIVHSSTLTSCNNGILVADISVLSPKLRKQFNSVICNPMIAAAGAPADACLTFSNTATIWAIGSSRSVVSAAHQASTAAKAAQPTLIRQDAFQLVLQAAESEASILQILYSEPDATVKDGDATFVRQQLQLQMAKACSLPPPLLTEASQAFLRSYYCLLRAESVPITQKDALHSLVKLATASARLSLRHEVTPLDCTLAVFLMEQSNGSQFHVQVLELPKIEHLVGRGDEASNTIDGVLPVLHALIQQSFKMHGVQGFGDFFMDQEED